MADQKEIKQIERRAKHLLLSKDINPAKMDLVRSIIANSSISQPEKYRTIIELIQSEPDKRNETLKQGFQTGETVSGSRPPGFMALAPTENSYYIEDILEKYRGLKIFKKRYLAKRNNMFHIGFRKRLIPSQKLLNIMAEVSKYQQNILVYLSDILLSIVNDEKIENPVSFNYLRIFRKWMLSTPLSNHVIDTVKWMERADFEREFRRYIISFFSFSRMKIEDREDMILAVETKLRELKDFKKEDIADSDYDRKEKEKRNLAREKLVYDYMMTVRSFLPTGPGDDSLIAKKLLLSYGINNLTELITIAAEALIYQRSFEIQEMEVYFGIKAPSVSVDTWDFDEDQLRKLGKDPDSKKRKELEYLKRKIVVYETINYMLQYKSKGSNILHRSVEEQWRLVDKKRYDINTAYEENFFSYIDALLHFFRSAYFPLIDGSSAFFRSRNMEEFQGSIFEKSYFKDENSRLEELFSEMHFFRSNNPTLVIKRKEVKKIMAGQIKSMAHVEGFARLVGDYFYKLASRLRELYDMHITWTSSVKKESLIHMARKPVSWEDISEPSEGRPLPFFDCILTGFESTDILKKQISGMQVMDETGREGLFVELISFCYQVSLECFNERVFRDIDDGKELIKKIDSLSKIIKN